MVVPVKIYLHTISSDARQHYQPAQERIVCGEIAFLPYGVIRSGFSQRNISPTAVGPEIIPNLLSCFERWSNRAPIESVMDIL